MVLDLRLTANDSSNIRIWHPSSGKGRQSASWGATWRIVRICGGPARPSLFPYQPARANRG
jgi:hypothetical protein